MSMTWEEAIEELERLTNEAVEMVMERMEALYEKT